VYVAKSGASANSATPANSVSILTQNMCLCQGVLCNFRK